MPPVCFMSAECRPMIFVLSTTEPRDEQRSLDSMLVGDNDAIVLVAVKFEYDNFVVLFS